MPRQAGQDIPNIASKWSPPPLFPPLMIYLSREDGVAVIVGRFPLQIGDFVKMEDHPSR